MPSSRRGRRCRSRAIPSGRTRSDYIDRLITDYMPLAGDRVFGEDAAIVGGVGRFRGRSVAVLGQEKGDDTEAA